MNDILHELERLSQVYGSHTFFRVQDGSGSPSFSFAQTNFAASALARELGKRGANSSSTVVCRLYNGPEAVVAALAAAYGGFDLALVSPRLSDAQYEDCVSQISEVALTLEEGDFARLMLNACGNELVEIAAMNADVLSSNDRRLGLADYRKARLDAFDPSAGGIVLFAAEGSFGHKAIELSWERMTSSAREANDQLKAGKDTVWQLILPLCGVDGFQVMVRSLMNATPFLMYERYSTQRVLNDVLPFKVTHISVIGTHLRDLLQFDCDAVLCQYQCILLGGGKPSHSLLKAATRVGAHLVVAHDDAVKADLVAHGHELGLDCTYDKSYINLVSNR